MQFTTPITVHFTRRGEKPITYGNLNQWRANHPFPITENRRWRLHWQKLHDIPTAIIERKQRQEHYPTTHQVITCGPQRGQTQTIPEHFFHSDEWLVSRAVYIQYASDSPPGGIFKRKNDMMHHHPTEPIRLANGPNFHNRHQYYHTLAWCWGDRFHRWDNAAHIHLHTEDLEGLCVIEETKREYFLFGRELSFAQWQWWNGEVFTWCESQQMHWLIQHGKPPMPKGIAAIESIG